MKRIYTTLIFALIGALSYSQDTLKCDFGADLVSRYLWRGKQLGGTSPHIQPYFSLTKSNFVFSGWSTYSLSSSYAEVDFTAAYNIKMFTVSVSDYFVMDETLPNNKYYKIKDDETQHALEGNLIFNGTENLPLKLLVGTFFYGNDRATSGKKYFSTYFEAGYPFMIKRTKIDAQIGFTPKESNYGETLGVCNISFTGNKEIEISHKYKLPVKLSLITNPQTENIYFVLCFCF